MSEIVLETYWDNKRKEFRRRPKPIPEYGYDLVKEIVCDVYITRWHIWGNNSGPFVDVETFGSFIEHMRRMWPEYW